MLKVVNSIEDNIVEVLDDFDNIKENTTKKRLDLLSQLGVIVDGFTRKEYSLFDYQHLHIKKHSLDNKKCCLKIEKIDVDGINIICKVTIGVSVFNKEKCIAFLNKDSHWREQYATNIDYIIANIINKLSSEEIKFIGGYTLSFAQIEELLSNDDYSIALADKFRLYLKNAQHMEEFNLKNRSLNVVFGEIKKKQYIDEEKIAEYFYILETLGYF